MALSQMQGEKFQRAVNYDRKHTVRPPKRGHGYKRYQDRNRHHLLPKSRGGGGELNNLLLINIEKHEAWHRLFKLATAEEVLDLLTRVVRAKKAQRSSAK